MSWIIRYWYFKTSVQNNAKIVIVGINSSKQYSTFREDELYMPSSNIGRTKKCLQSVEKVTEFSCIKRQTVNCGLYEHRHIMKD